MGSAYCLYLPFNFPFLYPLPLFILLLSLHSEMLAVAITKYNTTLTTLNLDECSLGVRGAALLLAALSHNTSLKQISLGVSTWLFTL